MIDDQVNQRFAEDRDHFATRVITGKAGVLLVTLVTLLCDHSKIGADDFFRFASLSQVDVLITDSGLDPDLAEDLRAAVPTVILT